jgi:hypothetical protein
MRSVKLRLPFRPGTLLIGLLIAGCASRSVDVKPLPANPADFAAWDCSRIDDELDSVQQHAADVAYAVDERAGNNIIALGVGVTIFWPAILAMRPDGLDAQELAGLKGRYEALRTAERAKGCPPPAPDLAPERAAALPVAVGERLVYEDRAGGRPPSQEWTLRLTALRREEFEFRLERGGTSLPWRQDRAGNVTAAPDGALWWPRLLHRDMVLGQVLAGEIDIAGDPMLHARVRGQVVAVGPQMLAGRHFDVAVIDLFGDAMDGDRSTRLEGAIVVDRTSGVLLRLELRSAMPAFDLQRRLSRVERPAP